MNGAFRMSGMPVMQSAQIEDISAFWNQDCGAAILTWLRLVNVLVPAPDSPSVPAPASAPSPAPAPIQNVFVDLYVAFT